MRIHLAAAAAACASLVSTQAQIADTTVKRAMPVTQAKPGARSTSPRVPAPSTKAISLPPDAPVVTLKGVCAPKPAPRAPQPATPVCQTVVTRGDLDGFIKAVAPDSTNAQRGRVAVQYARTLAFSELAEQQGFAKDPAVAKELAEQVKLAKMKVLSDAFLQSIQSKTVITEADVQTYYDQQKEQFETVTVSRLAVPFLVPNETGRRLEPAVVKAELEKLQKRAAAGEDMAQLQIEAFDHLHVLAPPPPLGSDSFRRGSVQGDEAKAFDMKVGEVSSVLETPASLAILKLESRTPLPLAMVRPEIQAKLHRDRVEKAIYGTTKDIKPMFNLEYLDMPAQPDVFAGLTTNTPAGNRSVPVRHFSRSTRP